MIVFRAGSTRARIVTRNEIVAVMNVADVASFIG